MKNLVYLGEITLSKLREFILQNRNVEKILLNRNNFDNLILEYRLLYNQGLLLPFDILGITIEEDYDNEVTFNRIALVYDSTDDKNNYLVNKQDTIFRCTFCGAMLNYNGLLLTQELAFEKRLLLETGNVNVFDIDGICCLNKYKR